MMDMSAAALDERLRLAVYRAFATTGRAPELADMVEADAGSVRAGLQRLAGARHLVLDDDGTVIMAHPFASIPLGFAVMGSAATTLRRAIRSLTS